MKLDDIARKFVTDDLDSIPIDETVASEAEALALHLDRLPAIPLDDKLRSQFGIASILGKGGMGIVHAADQISLSREVAIKRPTRASDRAAALLLREARVMGFLEHPSIPPVHLIARDEHDRPYVVMKRIDGVTMQETIMSPEGFNERTRLLEVLISVANAMDFAHSHGLVHLDLKPANIMIGEFGEVYVLDWGCAVAFREGLPEGIPRPEPSDTFQGTPRYVAPEMFTDEAPLGPATDIYLLGGILYAILTGEGPNRGASTTEVLEFAHRPKQRLYPESTPQELIDVCEKALARTTDDRHKSAGEFRKEIEAHIKQRGARQIEALAWTRLHELQMFIKRDHDEDDVVATFNTARSAFMESLQIWTGNQKARDGLQQTLEAFICYELEHDRPESALRLISELPDSRPELEERCKTAVDRRQKEFKGLKQDIERLAREVDPRVAGRSKAVLWAIIGLAIAVPQLLPPLLGKVPSAFEVTIAQGFFALILAGVVVYFRDRLLSTMNNRVLIGVVLAMVGYSLIPRAGAAYGISSLGYAFGLDLSLVVCFGIFLVAIVDRLLVAAVPCYVIGAIACFVRPDIGYLIFPVTHLVGMSILSFVYWWTDRA